MLSLTSISYHSRHAGPDVPRGASGESPKHGVAACRRVKSEMSSGLGGGGDDTFGKSQRGDSIYSKPLSRPSDLIAPSLGPLRS